MDVVAGEVESDQELKHKRICRVGRCEEAQQTRRRAAVCHHVEHSAKLARLPKSTRGLAIDSVQKARDSIQKRASFWVVRHVHEGGASEKDAGVA